jgi:hypothetical protein
MLHSNTMTLGCLKLVDGDAIAPAKPFRLLKGVSTDIGEDVGVSSGEGIYVLFMGEGGVAIFQMQVEAFWKTTRASTE